MSYIYESNYRRCILRSNLRRSTELRHNPLNFHDRKSTRSIALQYLIRFIQTACTYNNPEKCKSKIYHNELNRKLRQIKWKSHRWILKKKNCWYKSIDWRHRTLFKIDEILNNVSLMRCKLFLKPLWIIQNFHCPSIYCTWYVYIVIKFVFKVDFPQFNFKSSLNRTQRTRICKSCL